MLPSPQALIPAAFVLLWSTGFIGARLGLPFTEPMTFLALRFLAVIAIFALLLAWARPAWPQRVSLRHEAITGVLLHSGYLGGVFAAIDRGMPAALAALIVGLQPLLTGAVVGPLLGERVSTRQWLGLALGLAGVAMVLGEKLAPGGGQVFDGFGLPALGLTLVGLCSITAGTLYQKKYGGTGDWRWSAVAQYGAALLVTGTLALLVEENRVVWSPELIVALGWLVVVLSIGAIGLLMVLIRRGAAASVASLFYLVPPCTGVVAWLLFGETFGWLAIAGMVVAALGVALVNMRVPDRTPTSVGEG